MRRRLGRIPPRWRFRYYSAKLPAELLPETPSDVLLGVCG